VKHHLFVQQGLYRRHDPSEWVLSESQIGRRKLEERANLRWESSGDRATPLNFEAEGEGRRPFNGWRLCQSAAGLRTSVAQSRALR